MIKRLTALLLSEDNVKKPVTHFVINGDGMPQPITCAITAPSTIASPTRNKKQQYHFTCHICGISQSNQLPASYSYHAMKDLHLLVTHHNAKNTSSPDVVEGLLRHINLKDLRDHSIGDIADKLAECDIVLEKDKLRKILERVRCFPDAILLEKNREGWHSMPDSAGITSIKSLSADHKQALANAFVNSMHTRFPEEKFPTHVLHFGLMFIGIILSDTMLSRAKLPFKVDTSYKAVLHLIKEMQPALEEKNLTNASA